MCTQEKQSAALTSDNGALRRLKHELASYTVFTIQVQGGMCDRQIA